MESAIICFCTMKALLRLSEAEPNSVMIFDDIAYEKQDNIRNS